MTDESKRRLRHATIVYWVLLVYIIAALVWWAISLLHQNTDLYTYQKQNLELIKGYSPLRYQQELHLIEDQHRRNTAKYIGEGSIFLLLILVGAAFIYRSVRGQFRVQQQQQNFVMAVTHELKTPIAVARLNLETLQRHNLEEARRSKLIQTTLQETLRLDTLINNILISSQLDVQSYNASREELDFSALTEDVINQFSGRYPERALRQHISPDLDITGDPLLLKLLVSNLLENANKYSPRDKDITLNLYQHQKNLQLEVIDEGPGIAEEEKKNIFQKFYRIGNEQTRKAQGTGLGLYLCKKIAEDHKGSITVVNQQPSGSKFIVQLPV
jgi:signal transduction histidine kinase